MKLFKFVLLCLFLISPAKADTIYELIKIPNLEIYNIKTENKLRYLNAKQAFTIGIDNNKFIDLVLYGYHKVSTMTVIKGYGKVKYDGYCKYIEVSKFDNVYLATGFTGRGLMQAPGIGRVLTELITTGAYQSIDISNMSVERVLGKEARTEPYVL